MSVTGAGKCSFVYYIVYCVTGVRIWRFVFNRGYLCCRCGDWQMCLIKGMCVTGVGIFRFVFNIVYVCYRCGDLHVCV
jgi:hypothetical protein